MAVEMGVTAVQRMLALSKLTASDGRTVQRIRDDKKPMGRYASTMSSNKGCRPETSVLTVRKVLTFEPRHQHSHDGA
jgi:hypothetical protein